MGRKAEFDREQVIEQATDVFWTKGYHASSMTDLKAAMGLQPGSIYAAFGGKEELLLACLEQYSNVNKTRFEQLSETSPTQRDAFFKIYEFMIDQMKSSEKSRGCLIINTLLELVTHDCSGGNAARDYLDRNRNFFETMLQKAIDSGELQPNRPTSELASFLIGTVFSLRVMGKTGAERSVLESIRDQALEQVFD